jgi:anti-sigma-K factor RskA
MDIHEIRDLLPAYALGAIQPEERTQIEAALADSPELREELASYDSVLEALALSVPQIKPPPDLENRILRQAVTSRLFPWQRVLAAAAVLVMILGGVLVWQVVTQEDEKTEKDPITEIMDDPNSSHIQLTGMEEHPDVQGELVIAPGYQRAVLSLANLQKQPSGMAYQLWFVRNGERISGGVFYPEAASPERPMLVLLPEDFASYQWLGITIEPEQGSEEPTSPPVAGAVVELSPENE